MSIAADDRNVLDRGSHQYAGLTHEHDLVVQADLQRADHASIAIGNLQCNHALSAAPVPGEIFQRRELAESVFGRRQYVALLGDDQGVYSMFVAEPDAAHARRLAAHGTYFVLGETDRLAARREQQDVLGAIGDGDTHQLIAVIERDGDDAVRARPGKQAQRGLLHRT